VNTSFDYFWLCLWLRALTAIVINTKYFDITLEHSLIPFGIN